MLNQFVVVGRIQSISDLKETGSGFKYANLFVSITRSFKNSENVYECDIMNIMLWRGTAQSVIDICTTGDLVGIKGRIQSRENISAEKVTYYNYELIAEKVTILDREVEV